VPIITIESLSLAGYSSLPCSRFEPPKGQSPQAYKGPFGRAVAVAETAVVMAAMVK
jgi:hypothetical protein